MHAGARDSGARRAAHSRHARAGACVPTSCLHFRLSSLLALLCEVFSELVRAGGRIVPDPHVILRAAVRFGAAVAQARAERNVDLAEQVYELAANLPSTATVAEFGSLGLNVGAALYPSSPLTIAFRGRASFLLKPLTQREYGRALAFEAALGGATIPNVTTFELLTSASGHPFMLMPRYHDSLERCPGFHGVDAGILWQQMREGVEGIHALGFAHGDLKSANICTTEHGINVIVGLGSIARFDMRTTSTLTYVPFELQPAKGEQPRASRELDWWMLAVTMAEHACGAHKLAVGTRIYKKDQIRAHLQAYMTHDIALQEICNRL